MLAPRILLVLATTLPHLAIASAETPAIEQCLASNAPSGGRVLEVTLQPRRGSENGTATRAMLYLSRPSEAETRLLLRVTEPEDLRGTAVLLLKSDAEEADVFAYLPELDAVKKLKRRHLRGRLFETDLTVADLESLVGVVEDELMERLPDADLDGRPVWVFASKAVDEDARVVSHIDRETCLPLRTEFYDGRGALRRVLDADPGQVVRSGDGFVPTRIVLRDLERDSETRVLVERLRVDDSLPSELFERASLAPTGPVPASR